MKTELLDRATKMGLQVGETLSPTLYSLKTDNDDILSWTTDLATIVADAIRQLLFSVYQALPYNRRIGCDIQSLIYELPTEATNINQILSEVFANSEVFDLVSVNTYPDATDRRIVYIDVTIRVIPLNQIFTVKNAVNTITNALVSISVAKT